MTHNLLSRRALLKSGFKLASTVGAAAGLGHLGKMSAFAQSGATDYKALVCVFLFGGNDSNNMVIPMSGQAASQYTALRANLAVRNPLALGSTGYGLHPSMTALSRLYSQGNVALNFNVGTLVAPLTRTQFRSGAVKTPANLGSHADQQQEWQTASPLENITTGWGGRVADLFPPASAQSCATGISVAGNSALLVGQTSQQASMSANGFGLLGEDGSAATSARDAALQQIFKLDSGVTLVQASGNVLQGAIEMAALVKNAVGNTPLPVNFPGTSLGQQLAQVAQLIRARTQLGAKRQIFFASLGGFDTHSDQLNAQASLLQQLSDAIAAFHTSMSDSTIAAANEVTLFTESEFARTFQPNTNGGTDHAWGGHHLVVGGAVKGGLYGQFPNLALGGDSDADSRGNWIPTTSLDQYAATLAQWFGVSNLLQVFPNLSNFNPSDYNLGFV
jgi:uncharacterized protein (DUF1501 family)